MRTRQKTDILRSFPAQLASTPSWTLVKCTGGTATGQYLYLAAPSTASTYVESFMRDSLGRGIPHAVLHRTRHVAISEVNCAPRYANVGAPGDGVLDAPEVHLRDSFYGAKQTVDPMLVWDLTDPDTVPVGWSIDKSSLDYDDLYENAVQKAKGLKADVLLNLVEANQVWPSIKSLATCLPELERNWTRIRSMIKTASGAYLAWRFGVSPILSDIGSILKYLPKIGEDFKRHEEMGTLRFSASRAFVATFPEQHIIDGSHLGIPIYTRQYRGQVDVEPSARVVLVVEPRVKYKTGFFRALDLTMRRFATSPASLAWERIPFSFVADWFVDLRGTLNAVDRAIGAEPFVLKAATRSFTYNLVTRCSRQNCSPCDGSLITQWPESIIAHKHYDRSPVSASAMPRWKPRFGKSQAAVSAALILQQLSKLRR
jgi:hypothetical protein